MCGVILQITNAEEVLRKCQDWTPPGSQRPARCEGTAFVDGGMPADVAALRRADILVRQLLRDPVSRGRRPPCCSPAVRPGISTAGTHSLHLLTQLLPGRKLSGSVSHARSIAPPQLACGLILGCVRVCSHAFGLLQSSHGIIALQIGTPAAPLAYGLMMRRGSIVMQLWPPALPQGGLTVIEIACICHDHHGRLLAHEHLKSPARVLHIFAVSAAEPCSCRHGAVRAFSLIWLSMQSLVTC